MWTVLAFAGLLASFLVAYKYIWANRKDAYPPTLQQEKKILGEDESEENPSVRARQPWDYFLVLDVEATCVPGADFSWPNEIIEWPVVLLSWADRDEADGKACQLKVVDEFRSLVKPTWKPKLSDFCTSLTGISQAQIDGAPIFTEVLKKFRQFLASHGLICAKTGRSLQRFVWATDGPFDIRDFVVKQCFISKIKLPEYLKGDVIDIRKEVANLLTRTNKIPAKNPSKWSPSRTLNLTRQLAALSLSPFEGSGRQHSGIDDTRNIARILTELGRRGVRLEPNLRIQPGRRWYWMGQELGEIVESYFP